MPERTEFDNLHSPRLMMPSHHCLSVEMQVVTLTATGAVVTFLRHGRARIRRTCVGLEDGDPESALVAVAFDAGRGYRAYGLNGRGELLTMVVPADKRSSVCRVSD